MEQPLLHQHLTSDVCVVVVVVFVVVVFVVVVIVVVFKMVLMCIWFGRLFGGSVCSLGCRCIGY